MKRAIFFMISLGIFANLSAQHIYNIPSVQPASADFDNVHVLPLESDSLCSSFMIWVKKTVPAHYHQYHTEQVIILEGEGMMQMGDQQLKVMAGDFITIPKNTVHSVVTTSAVPLKVLSIQSPRFEGKDRIIVKQ